MKLPVQLHLHKVELEVAGAGWDEGKQADQDTRRAPLNQQTLPHTNTHQTLQQCNITCKHHEEKVK